MINMDEEMTTVDVRGTPVLLFRDNDTSPIMASLHGGRYTLEFLKELAKAMEAIFNTMPSAHSED